MWHPLSWSHVTSLSLWCRCQVIRGSLRSQSQIICLSGLEPSMALRGRYVHTDHLGFSALSRKLNSALLPVQVYEGLRYRLSLEFPAGYPYQAPRVKFVTPCFHPNVDEHGFICLDILKDKWSALYDVRSILLSIQSLLGGKCVITPALSKLCPLTSLSLCFLLRAEQRQSSKWCGGRTVGQPGRWDHVNTPLCANTLTAACSRTDGCWFFFFFFVFQLLELIYTRPSRIEAPPPHVRLSSVFVSYFYVCQ